jgi:hypothetical protein
LTADVCGDFVEIDRGMGWIHPAREINSSPGEATWKTIVDELGILALPDRSAVPGPHRRSRLLCLYADETAGGRLAPPIHRGISGAQRFLAF